MRCLDDDQTVLKRAGNRMGGVGGAKLEARRLDIYPQGMFGNRERIGDLRARIAHGEKSHGIDLTGRERAGSLWGAVRLKLQCAFSLK